MSPPRSWTGPRGFWLLLRIGLGALATGSIVAIATAGPRASADPAVARITLLAFLVPSMAAFGLATIGTIRGWLAPRRSDAGVLVIQAGLTIATAAMIPIVAVLPEERGHGPVPLALRLPLSLGLGVLVAGATLSMVPALRRGLRRRDPLPLVALLLIAGMVILIASRN